MREIDLISIKRPNVKTHKYIDRRKKNRRVDKVSIILSIIVALCVSYIISASAAEAWDEPECVTETELEYVNFDRVVPDTTPDMIIEADDPETTDIFEGEHLSIMEEVIPTYKNLVKPEPDSDEYMMMLKLVEAEVTGDHRDYKKSVTDEDALLSKVKVARVILNRVASNEWPNTLRGVMTEKNQFTPFLDKRYYSAKPTDLTVKAIDMAFDASVRTEADQAYYFRMGNGDWKASGCIHRDKIGVGYYIDI